MDACEITERYYSRWLGASENLFSGSSERSKVIYTAERNEEIPGYGRRFDLWALDTTMNLFVSYGDAVKNGIPELEALLRSNVPLAEALQCIYGAEPEHNVKYLYAGKALDIFPARVLTGEDYPAYERFFRTCNPGVRDVSWLREFFVEMAGKRLCCGVFTDGLLVSCTDAPTVPYMPDKITEIGINTLEAYRRRGYARAACACCIREILADDRYPIWSTGADNSASQRLAESLGFVRFGEVCALTLS